MTDEKSSSTFFDDMTARLVEERKKYKPKRILVENGAVNEKTPLYYIGCTNLSCKSIEMYPMPIDVAVFRCPQCERFFGLDTILNFSYWPFGPVLNRVLSSGEIKKSVLLFRDIDGFCQWEFERYKIHQEFEKNLNFEEQIDFLQLKIKKRDYEIFVGSRCYLNDKNHYRFGGGVNRIFKNIW
jgi:hypothetical protein